MGNYMGLRPQKAVQTQQQFQDLNPEKEESEADPLQIAKQMFSEAIQQLRSETANIKKANENLDSSINLAIEKERLLSDFNILKIQNHKIQQEAQSYKNRVEELLNQSLSKSQEIYKLSCIEKECDELKMHRNNLQTIKLERDQMYGEVERLKAICDRLMREKSTVQNEVKNLQGQKNHIASEFSSFKEKIKQRQIKKSKINQEEQQTQTREIESLRSKLQRSQTEKQSLATALEKTSAEKKETQNEKEILLTSLHASKQAKQILQGFNAKLQKENQQIRNITNNQKTIVDDLTEKMSKRLSEQQSQIVQLEQLLAKEKEKSQNLRDNMVKRVKEIAAKLEQQKEDIIKEKSAVQEKYNQIYNDYQTLLHQVNIQTQQTQQKINDLLENQKKLKDSLREKQNKEQVMTEELTKLKEQSAITEKQMKEQIQHLESQATLQQQQKLTAELQLQEAKAAFEEQRKRLDPRLHALFANEIFEKDFEGKTRLIAMIENYSNKKILSSRLLYRYDPLNSNNVHKYIDDKPGLLCVAMTKNAVVAGFYPGALRTKVVLDEGGLIISVTNNKSYTLVEKTNPTDKKIYKGMIYDEFYVIFGNSELRLKSGTKEVMSMFNTNASYFNNGGDKVSCILNQGDKRETTFELCEYYQVFFDENQYK